MSYKESRLWMKAGILATLLFHGFYAAWLLLRPVSPHVTALGDDVLATLGGALAALFCFLPVPGPAGRNARSRQIAWLCGLSMACYVLQQVYIIYPDFLHRPTPMPRLAGDAVGLAASPLLLLGIWRLPRRQLSLSSQIRVSLDGLMAMTAVATFSWYFVLGPTLLNSHKGLEEKVVNALYLLMDLLLAACLLFLGGLKGQQRAILVLFFVGLLIVVGSDSAFGYLALHGTYRSGILLDIGWSLGFMLVGVAVRMARQASASAAAGADIERLPPLWKSFLPYALLPLVAALVLYTEEAGGEAALRHGVSWGALALVGVVIARQVLALLENRELNGRLEALATTDPLTGLCNHRTFHSRLADEAAEARREGRTLGVAMLDLDNFKFFNDAYGHAAGDEVLRQIAGALRRNTLPGDTLARFGGDEFALILPVLGERAGESAPGLTARLEESLSALVFHPPDSEAAIPLTISVGIALLPDDAATHLEALELADRRLMHSKTGGSGHAVEQCQELTLSVDGFSMLNALVTAVDNKDRYTRRHSEDVMEYSLQIAGQLGLPGEVRRTVQIAALLHDVGKIGVPDRILRKPSRLTDEEYQAVQQHPLMGAVIVGAVPGFEETLDAVRHHHERWDGRGYPLGLRGPEIPPLARLIAVADAFSAMTTDRPYRKGMVRETALRILEEGAGTQWEPECVHALLRAYRPAEERPAAGDCPAVGMQRAA